MPRSVYPENVMVCEKDDVFLLTCNLFLFNADVNWLPGSASPREWGTLGMSGWGCAAGTLEPLTYTKASSAEFCYPILE